MEMQQVRYFLAVCEKRSFTAAAKFCGVTQPSLTNGIKALERALGGELFVRSTPVELSDLGRKVRPSLEAIGESERDIARIVAMHRRPRSRSASPIDREKGHANSGGPL
jgi:DNA-binding transcriptional LysR family regulator